MIYEIKKLFSSRVLLAASTILLIANCFFAFIETAYSKDWDEAVFDFVQKNEEDPAFYRNRYEEYLMAREQAINNQMDAVMRNEDPEKYVLEEPHTIAPDTEFTDSEFYSALIRIDGYTERYVERLRKVIETSDYNLRVVTDSYTAAYLSDVKKIYTERIAQPPSGQLVTGWDSYFSYTGTSLFLFLAVSIAALLLASFDSFNRNEQLLFASQKGPRGIVRQKILTLSLFCFIAVVVFECATFLTVWAKANYCGASAPLTTLEEYMLCPVDMTIGTYALFRIFIRTIVLICAGLLMMLMARLIKHPIGYLAFSAALLGGNYALEAVKAFPLGSIWHNLNLFHLFNTENIFKQYTSVNVFGISIALPLAGSLLCFLCIGLTVSVLLAIWKRFSVCRQKSHSFHFSKSCIPHTSLGLEMKKSLIGAKLIIPLIAIVVVKIALGVFTAVQPVPYTEQIYKNYMTVLQGRPKEEKQAFLKGENDYFEGVFREYESDQEKYEKGEISYAQLMVSETKARSAEKKYEVFLKVKSEYERIVALNENGTPAAVVYGTGWERLVLGKPDLMMLLLVAVFVFVYSLEKNESLMPLLYTTPFGKRKIFAWKALLSVVISCIGSVVFAAIDLLSISNSYPVAEWGALVSSVPGFGSASSMLTLGGSFIFLVVKRVFLSGMLSFMAVCFSERTRIRFLAPVAFLGFMFVPYLACIFIDDLAKYASVPLLFSFHQEFDFGYLPLAIMLLTLFLASILGILFRRWKMVE